MSDAGVYGKQSAAFSAALAMETTLRNNIAYNLPRSGFNFNDHFGGGNNISNNLIFSTVGKEKPFLTRFLSQSIQYFIHYYSMLWGE
jgi:ABC-type transport system involved in cytochrome bd biosynthesis fused ATPase/permease subunit